MNGQDIAAYRHATDDVVDEVQRTCRVGDRASAEALLVRRLHEPELTTLLTATPRGMDAATQTMVDLLRSGRPDAHGAAKDLPRLVRICLLSQIEALWWDTAVAKQGFDRDVDVDTATNLVDLDSIRSNGALGFAYRHQSDRLVSRGRDWMQKRVAPRRRPPTAGLRFARTRPEVLGVLNRLAAGVASELPAGAPRFWVTSLARSVEHQMRLRALGYPAILPSSHCGAYAADVDVRWFGQFDPRGVLRSHLLQLQDAGEANVIDEGAVWHVCISPRGSAL